jgi:hypothetical protein
MEKTTVWVYSVLNHVTLRLVETEDNLEQQKQQQTDRRTTVLRVFDNISEDGQANALLALEALSRVFPRRSPVSLRLIPGGGGKVGGDSE